MDSQFFRAPLCCIRHRRSFHASYRLASSRRGRRLQYLSWSAQLQGFTSLFTTWRDMKPVGKVLCATAFVVGFLAVFWKDSFKPGRLSSGVIPTWNGSRRRETLTGGLIPALSLTRAGSFIPRNKEKLETKRKTKCSNSISKGSCCLGRGE